MIKAYFKFKTMMVSVESIIVILYEINFRVIFMNKEIEMVVECMIS